MRSRILFLVPSLLVAVACGSSLDGGPGDDSPSADEGSSGGNQGGIDTPPEGGNSSTGGVPGGIANAGSTGGGGASSGGTAPNTTPMCGNNVVEEGEVCDGAELAGADCSSLGYSSGALACSVSCQFDTAPCQGGGTLVTEERTFCSDTCWKPEYINDGKCYDGGPNSNFNSCEFGSDCSDCGSQTIDVPIVSGGGRAACGQQTFGVNEGDPAEDWTTFNQYGAAVSLSDFCGKWVYMEVGAIWCPVCRAHAPGLEAMVNELGDYADGLVVVDALYEVLNPIKPNATDIPLVPELKEWADEFGQVKVHAVSDAHYEIWTRYWPLEDKKNPPRGILINPDGVIERIGQAKTSMVKSAMDNWD